MYVHDQINFFFQFRKVSDSYFESWEIHPKPLLSLHRKGQLAGCSLGYRLYFCVSKSSSGRRLHEAETDSRLTSVNKNS
jgi:hypothetical protein